MENEQSIVNLPIAKDSKEINACRAMVFIPAIITIVCTIWDLVSQDIILRVNIWGDLLWCKVIISYFFPSLFATAIGMIWTYHFGTGYSGIRKDRIVYFDVATFVLFVIYVVYLFTVDTVFPVIFIAILAAYLFAAIKYLMDDAVLKNAGLQNRSISMVTPKRK